jgi:hypothetical protein
MFGFVFHAPSISNDIEGVQLFDDVSVSLSLDRSCDISCLEKMALRFLTTTVRRTPVTKETYQTIGQLQSKYQKGAKLVVPRSKVISTDSGKKERRGGIFQQNIKEKKQRRDQNEVRSKGKSQKTSFLWDALEENVVKK